MHNLDSLTTNVETGRAELEELAERLAESEKRLHELDEAAEKSRDDGAELSDSYAAANSELLTVIDELNTITSGGELNKEKLAGIERELGRLQNEIESAEEKLASGRNELELMLAADEDLNKEMDSVREELRNAVLVYNEHSGRSAQISSDIEGLRSKMIDLSNKNVGRNAEISTLNRYQKTLEERSETLREEFEGRDKAEAENRAGLERLEAEIAENSKVLEGEKERIFEIANNIQISSEFLRAMRLLLRLLSADLSSISSAKLTQMPRPL